MRNRGLAPGSAIPPADRELIESIIQQLETLSRLPTSPGERAAARLVDQYLRLLAYRSNLESVPAHRSYAVPIGAMCLLSAAVTWFARGRHRFAGAVASAALSLSIVDDISNGPMLFRRLFLRPGITDNVVATAGDPAASTTLVVMAHHDAAPSGAIFDQSILEWLARTRPQVLDRLNSNPPLWWVVVGGPLLGAVGGVLNVAPLRWLGLALEVGSAMVMVDIGRRTAVPGANDNLSGVAVLVALARRLTERPPEGLRVMLVSAGAEESLQQGMRGFERMHFPGLDPSSTYYVNLDCVGSGRLVLLEGEGPIRMRYYDPYLKSLTAACAAELGIEIVRGLRSRNSTDGVVPLLGGYSTVTLVSVNEHKLMPHYHLYTDTLENLDLSSVIRTIDLVEAVARNLTSRLAGVGV